MGTGTGTSGNNQGTSSSAGGTGGLGTGAAPGDNNVVLKAPPVKMRDETWVIILIILAGIGILLTIVFEIYLMSKIIGDPFIKHWRTMWLGQLLLLAIFLCYLSLFAFVPTPTKYSCGIIRCVVHSSQQVFDSKPACYLFLHFCDQLCLMANTVQVVSQNV